MKVIYENNLIHMKEAGILYIQDVDEKKFKTLLSFFETIKNPERYKSKSKEIITESPSKAIYLFASLLYFVGAAEMEKVEGEKFKVYSNGFEF